ncbi:MAG TPA: HAMP domain-containing sensor histidine kinase, partial [Polyangiaceae bacterium]|nr:HAMP domain-containing sensor histidine kinase [Polyangiaceae bacterium]
LKVERAAADEALRRERMEEARTLAALLPLEREKTDRYLLTERARSDDAVAHRDDFLGMVSHDLRTLLGGIAMSAAFLLSLPAEGEAGERTHVEARRIRRFTARMNRLIGDLLDVVSIESGKLQVVPERHDAARLLNETLEAFQPIASAKGVAIGTEVRGGSALASFDHERILQVLANLVSNAIKFTESGGRVGLRIEPAGDDVRFTVRDSGPGVAAEAADSIFERFWQADRNDRRGLGLGLYISRCIVEAHGGKIWVESEPGKGSAFHFTLPGARRAEATRAK